MDILDYIKNYNGSNSIVNSAKNEYYRSGIVSKSKMAFVKNFISTDMVNNKDSRVYTMAPIQIKKNTERILRWKGKHSVVDKAIQMYKRQGRITESMMNRALSVIGDNQEIRVKDTKTINKYGVRLTPTQYKAIKSEYSLDDYPKIVCVNKITHMGKNSVTVECNFDGNIILVPFSKVAFEKKVGSIKNYIESKAIISLVGL